MRQLGIGLQSDKPPGTYGEIGRLAETGGIDVVTVFSDLMYQPPLPALLEIAQVTSRIELGFSCLNPYTMAPHEIAGQVAVLDHASRGRAFLGLARGAWLGDVGIDTDRPLQHLKECWEVVRRLIGGDLDGYDGEVFRLSGTCQGVVAGFFSFSFGRLAC